jgi:hypothetical protein
MSRKKKALFATDNNGKLYVQVSAVMHPLIPFTDGLEITVFGKEKTMYLDIDQAIEWCKREARSRDPEKYATMIGVMEKAKAQEAALKGDP